MKLRAMGINVSGPTTIFCDNASAIYSATKLSTAIRIRHLALDYHNIRECASKGIIAPEKIDTKENVSDLLTKNTDGVTFRYFISMLLKLEYVERIREVNETRSQNSEGDY